MPRLCHHIALLLVLSLVLSATSLLVTQSAFLLRRGFIAQHLCENRFVPDSPCEGMCYLKKHLDEHEHDPHDEQAVFRSVLVMVWDLPRAATPFARPERILCRFSHVEYADTGTLLAADLFRPPRQRLG